MPHQAIIVARDKSVSRMSKKLGSDPNAYPHTPRSGSPKLSQISGYTLCTQLCDDQQCRLDLIIMLPLRDLDEASPFRIPQLNIE